MNKIGIASVLLLFTVLGTITALNTLSDQTFLAARPAKPPILQASYLYPQPRVLESFALKDQYGNRFDNQRLLNKWSLIFIGYTSCPDVCPTTMAKLASAYTLLAPQIDLQVVFISVDPARDSQQKRLDYINFFNRNFIAATASHQQLVPLTRQLGMIYTMVGEGENYQVDHSTSMTLISPDGRRYANIQPTTNEMGSIPQIRLQDLVDDINKISHHYQATL